MVQQNPNDFDQAKLLLEQVGLDANALLAGAGENPQDADVPEYVAGSHELEDFVDSVRAGENVLLTGPTSCGKTNLVQFGVLKVLGKPLYIVPGGDGLTYEHLIGQREVVNEGGVPVTKWRDGIMTLAARDPRGAVLYIDEPNALPDGVRFHFYSLADHRRELVLLENGGEVVRAPPGFVVVAAMNEGVGYTGVSSLSFALRSRFTVGIDMDYLPKEKESTLIRKRTGIEKATADKMVEVASMLRHMHKKKEVRVPIGTRALLAWASLIMGGKDPVRAGHLTVVSQVPSTYNNERKAIGDAIDAMLAAKTEEQDDDGNGGVAAA